MKNILQLLKLHIITSDYHHIHNKEFVQQKELRKKKFFKISLGRLLWAKFPGYLTEGCAQAIVVKGFDSKPIIGLILI